MLAAGKRGRLTVDPVVHHEASSIGDALGLLLVGSLVVVRQTDSLSSASAGEEREQGGRSQYLIRFTSDD